MSRSLTDAIADSARHHQTSKTFSGSLAFHHAAAIKTLVKRIGATSVLDYGAGKGEQYQGEGSLDAFWGVPVTKYDPAWPPFAAQPKGRFDLVICTHTLCWIPVADLHDMFNAFAVYARHAVYIGEMVGAVPKKAGIVRNPEDFPFGWSRARWQQAIRASGLQQIVDVTLSTFDAADDAHKLTTRKVPA
jgi:hypothetical protein